MICPPVLHALRPISRADPWRNSSHRDSWGGRTTIIHFKQTPSPNFAKACDCKCLGYVSQQSSLHITDIGGLYGYVTTAILLCKVTNSYIMLPVSYLFMLAQHQGIQ